jgi:antitoxin component of MazEF toxin-antitoxin module
MSEPARVLFCVKIAQWGRSTVVSLQHALLEAIGAKVGDMLLVRVHPPYVTFRVAKPEAQIPVETFRPDDFPPAWPKRAEQPEES